MRFFLIVICFLLVACGAPEPHEPGGEKFNEHSDAVQIAFIFQDAALVVAIGVLLYGLGNMYRIQETNKND